MKIQLTDSGFAKTQVIKALEDALKIKESEAKDIVDSCPVAFEVNDDKKGSELLQELLRMGCDAGTVEINRPIQEDNEEEGSTSNLVDDDNDGVGDVSWHTNMTAEEMQKFFKENSEKLAKLDELKAYRKANKKPEKVDKPIGPVASFVFTIIVGLIIGALVGLIGWWLFSITAKTFWIIVGIFGVLFIWRGIDMVKESKKEKPKYEQYLYDFDVWQAKDDKYKMKIDLLSVGMPSFKELRGVIFNGINEKLLLPFNEKWITKQNYLQIIDDLLNMLTVNENAKNEHDPKKRRQLLMQLSNEKLKFFYSYSLKGEAGDDKNAYLPFYNDYQAASRSGDIKPLRKDSEELQIVRGIKTKTDFDIQECKDLLDDNRMEPILAQLNDVKNSDTSVLGLGLFTSTDKLAAKTKAFQDLCKAAKSEYDELANINEQLNSLLVNVRLKAYRNIYLCVDLVNFIRANAGGSKLTTQKDSVQIGQIDLNNVAISATDINMDMGANVGNTLGNITNRLLDSKSLRKFAINNPKMAAGAAAIEVAQNLLKERNDTIEKNNQLQAQLIKNIDQIVDSYNYGKGEMMRVIEIIKAIAKANKGVVSIYAELREKYYTENPAPVSQMEMMKDLQALAKATQEYKHISDSKL